MSLAGTQLRPISPRVSRKLTPKERVFEGVEFDLCGGCWLWSGSTNPNGYGQLSYKGKINRAHRFSYEAFIGPIPKDKMICHRCDTRTCCNPDHMFLGTAQDNVTDMVKKGRNLKGPEKSLNIFLSDTNRKIPISEYASIISRRESGETLKGIAADYGVSLSSIHKIDTRKMYSQRLVLPS